MSITNLRRLGSTPPRHPPVRERGPPALQGSDVAVRVSRSRRDFDPRHTKHGIVPNGAIRARGHGDDCGVNPQTPFTASPRGVTFKISKQQCIFARYSTGIPYTFEKIVNFRK